MLQLIKNFITVLGNIFRKPRTVVYPREKIYRSIVSPVIGTHAGPHPIAVVVLEAGNG